VIHERKLRLHHELACRVMVDVLPELATAEFVAVSDDEFTDLLKIFLKGAHVVKCENHGCSKIKHWVKNHGGVKEDCTVYVSDFRLIMSLLHVWLSCVLSNWSIIRVILYMQHI
jgi:hypothetical protein